MPKLCIIGGGTAGWWTAAYFEKHTDWEIVQYESPSVPILGVGESTLPQIKWFFEDLGLRESDWFDECQAVYKFGNYKYNWNKQGDFLPLMFEYDNQRHYAYHICAEKSGELMKYICKRTEKREEHLNRLPEGFDLYIDCTGFTRKFVRDPSEMKIGRHYVNTALVCPMEHDKYNEYTKEYTESIALKYGWLFRIHLQNRIGVGYVYSSHHCTDKVARKEFEQYMDRPLREPRIIHWRPLVLKNPWADNVVAIGTSAGFVDPLDATALYNLQAGIVNLVRCLDKKPMVYNRLMRRIHNDALQFVEHQYGLSKREDTSFWSLMSDREKYIPTFWKNHDTRTNPHQNIFPKDIWKQIIPQYELEKNL